MAASDCIRLIREQAPDLTDDELEQIVGDLQRRLNARKARGELVSVEDALLNEADEMAQEVAAAAQIEKRNRAINIVREARLRELVQRADDAMGDPSLGLEAAMVGVNARFAGARQSVDAQGKALFSGYAGGMIAELRKAGLLTTFNTRRLEREIAQEMAELNKADGSPGVSGVKEAQDISRILHKYQRAVLQRQNRAGAWIKPLDGFIVTQSHDMARIRRASARLGGPATRDPETNFQAWKAYILPLLDERTFDDVENADDFLRGAYEGLTTGKHLKTEGMDSDNDLQFAFKGPGNLAKRVSEHRKLHFRDADAWLKYNDRFGTRGLTDAFVQDIERGSRNIALMETLGTNPRAMFDKLQDTLAAEFRSDPAKVDRINRRGLENQFREIDGTASIPGNPSWAHMASALRALQTLSKLGGAWISSLADLAFHASEIRAQDGRSVLGAYGQTMQNLIDGFPTNAERRAAADLIGVGLEGQIGDIAARFTAQDHTAGRVSKMQQVFFKLNLLGPWTDANKRGIGLMMARDLAMHSDKAWQQIPERVRFGLEAYGMDEARWGIARQAVRDAPDGRVYLMPDAVRDLPDEIFGDVAPRRRNQMRDEIETALRSYIVDRADFASPTPGARERAMLRQGLQPGTFMGELARFVTQFKAFPITALTKPLGRDVFGGGARTYRDAFLKGQADLVGLAGMIAGSTVLGYLAQSAKEITKGRSPRDPEDPATWTAAMLQGGGLGIYGDFLLGETNRFGRSMLDTLAGPTLGTLSEIDQIRAKIMAGEDVDADALRVAMSNVPFVNLFYTRAALDYLIFYQLQEMVNPGYLRRMERRVKREQNQTFILPPSEAVGVR